jgi:DNA-binding NtrC family response regulator
MPATDRSDLLHVLVIDDEPALREVLSMRLVGWGYRVQVAGDVPEALGHLRSARPDVVLSDVVLPGMSGLDLLRRLRDELPDVPVVLMTAHGTIETAVEAMKEGAEDFLTKPIDPAALRAQLATVAGARRAAARATAMRAQLEGVHDDAARFLIGDSVPMRALRRQLAIVAASDASVLITGESGTGKEMAARAIHASSARAGGPFVALNAAAIPEGLLESEVFGHERGAFTGAVASRAGCFEQADRGTLLLDELAEMPIGLQPKLLRVLEDGRVRRLGSAREQTFDVRLVAATNRDLVEAVRTGRLREDLMYRLNVFTFALPALRERAEDIPLLVHHFLQHYAEKHGRQIAYVREEALEQLAAWHWPGNVRELRNVVERAVVLASGRWLEASHLPSWLTAEVRRESEPLMIPPDATLADAERLLIASTLERAGHNKAEAARRLGVDVKTIRNKLRAWSTD